MSLYVEIGYPADGVVDVETMLTRTLEDLKRVGVIEGQQLVSWHSVVLDPAYVHITDASIRAHAALKQELATHGVHSIGRYGGWTYCSIEDNVLEARALAPSL
jgi:protoporphyrinogen oxidase